MTHHLTKTEFVEKVFDFETHQEWHFEGAQPCIVDFYADWCYPCRVLDPVLEELSEEYAGKIDVYRIDTATEPQVAAVFRIRNIPTLLFVPLEGQPRMIVGVVPKKSIRQAIQEVFGIAPP